MTSGKPCNGDGASSWGQQGASKDFQMRVGAGFSTLITLDPKEITGCFVNQEIVLFLGRTHRSKLQRVQIPGISHPHGTLVRDRFGGDSRGGAAHILKSLRPEQGARVKVCG